MFQHQLWLSAQCSGRSAGWSGFMNCCWVVWFSEITAGWSMQTFTWVVWVKSQQGGLVSWTLAGWSDSVKSQLDGLCRLLLGWSGWTLSRVVWFHELLLGGLVQWTLSWMVYVDSYLGGLAELSAGWSGFMNSCWVVWFNGLSAGWSM